MSFTDKEIQRIDVVTDKLWAVLRKEPHDGVAFSAMTLAVARALENLCPICCRNKSQQFAEMIKHFGEEIAKDKDGVAKCSFR